MKKGSLVKLREDEEFNMGNLIKAHFLGIRLPLHDEIFTLREDPIVGICTCGIPDCENGTRIIFEEIPNGQFSIAMFEEVQGPEEVQVAEIVDSLGK